jgi:two-component system chemotaxis response regulator CheY
MSSSVLIVDDAAFMREMLRDILMGAGYSIVGEAADGEEAEAKFREYSPDVVTLDIVMPKKCGLDALRSMIELDPGACVVMCSALGQESLVMEALEAGARDYIVKPFKPDQVITVVGRALEKTSQE